LQKQDNDEDKSRTTADRELQAAGPQTAKQFPQNSVTNFTANQCRPRLTEYTS